MRNWSEILADAGMRATSQRVALMEALFGDGKHRHVSADDVYSLMRERGMKVSLATVYNTLNMLVRAGLLHEVSFDAGRVWFDTNTENHFHLFDEDTDQLMDIPATDLPDFILPPEHKGKAVRRVDLVVRVSSSPS